MQYSKKVRENNRREKAGGSGGEEHKNLDKITLETIQKNETVRTYIRKADMLLAELGFTEHAFAHVTKVSYEAGDILEKLGYDDRTCELARIAGYLHDIGNGINRIDHAQSGAVMAFTLLTGMGMDGAEISDIIAAIGNHDEGTAAAISPVAAALILADKGDVRRSRVRNGDVSSFDIHDRVNYAATESNLVLNPAGKQAVLSITIDTKICQLMDYFEIFLGRMILCRKAADYLGLAFELVINGVRLL